MSKLNKEPDVLIQVPAELHYLPGIGQFAKNLFMHHPLLKGMENLIFNLELVVSESCSNVVRHAYPEDSPGALRMQIWFEGDKVKVQIIDYGRGFEPDKIPAPDFESPREGGMGLYIIRQTADFFDYFKEKDANVLHLELNIY